MSPPGKALPAPSTGHRQPSDAELPFTIGSLRKAVPAHCFERSLLRSSLYLLADLTAVALLVFACLQIDRLPWWAAGAAWPVYWFCQVRLAVPCTGSQSRYAPGRVCYYEGIFPVAHCTRLHRCCTLLVGICGNAGNSKQYLTILFFGWEVAVLPPTDQFMVAQGAVCVGVWVLAHECGHQAFSRYQVVNDSVGLVLHSCLLVPYYSWCA